MHAIRDSRSKSPELEVGSEASHSVCNEKSGQKLLRYQDMRSALPPKTKQRNAERFPKLQSFHKKIELPMLVLCFIWLCVLLIELVNGPNPVLSDLGNALWIVFVAYFLIRLFAAANRKQFLKKNRLFVVAILVSLLRLFPTLQPLPIVRVLTATFGVQVLWIFVSADQGMRSLRRTLGKRGVVYALAFTAIVLFAGAAGLLQFERDSADPLRIQSYFSALWWAAMQMTNIGSSYSIKTTGGRIVALAVSIYSAGMFGYLTALVASFIIDRDTGQQKLKANNQQMLLDIKSDLASLKESIGEQASRPRSHEQNEETPQARPVVL